MENNKSGLDIPFWAKRMDYLEGKEGSFKKLGFGLLGLVGFIWLWFNITKVVDFLSDFGTAMELLILNIVWVAVAMIVGFGAYLVLSNPLTWRLIAMVFDGLIRRAELMYRAGSNKVLAAYFDLELLERKVNKFKNAKNIIHGIYTGQVTKADKAKKDFLDKKAKTEGLEKDLNNRVATKELKVQDDEYQILKARLTGLKEETISAFDLLQLYVKDIQNQSKKLSQITVFQEILTTRVSTGRAKLKDLESKLENALANKRAMEAYDDIMDGTESQNFEDQLERIQSEIDLNNAVADTISLYYEPQAASYVIDKRIKSASADEAFQRMMQEMGAPKEQIKAALNPADPTVSAFDEFMRSMTPGNTAGEKVLVRSHREIDDLLKF
jgi:hypothetical protein